MAMDIEEELEHSERGPSTAHRWRLCPGSVRMSRGIPNEAGIEAAVGTVFHEFAAICLEHGLDPQGFVGAQMTVEPFGVLTFTQAMADNMLPGLDVIRAYMASPTAITLVERRVSLEDWVGPREFGTTDCVVIDIPNRRIVVFDWKYGSGVPVSPVRNDQCFLYGLGAYSQFVEGRLERAMFEAEEFGEPEDRFDHSDIEVIFIIEQPRAEGGGGVWTTDLETLLEEGRAIRADARKTEDPNAPLVPGTKQCKFCPAAKKSACPAYPKFLLDLAGADFDDLEAGFFLEQPVEIPSVFSPEARSQLLLHKPMFDKMFERLQESALDDARKGRATPGLKLVKGRASARSWVDEEKAKPLVEQSFGREKAYTKKLLSPTQAEELLGKKEFNARFGRHVKKGEQKSTLVPVTDKREAIQSYAQDFDDLTDDETAIV